MQWQTKIDLNIAEQTDGSNQIYNQMHNLWAFSQ